MAAIETKPDGTILRTAEWARAYESIPALMAARAQAEAQALAAFLAARVEGMPEGERPTGDLADDLRRRLRDAAHAELAKPDASIPLPAPESSDAPGGFDIAIPVGGAHVVYDAHALEARIFAEALARAWPAVLDAWRDAHRPSPAGFYRLPYAIQGPHRVLGGKRHGKDVGMRVEGSAARDRVRLTIVLPKGKHGSQLSLELGTNVRAAPEDYDANGSLRPDAILRMVRDATGPQLAMIGHAAFALAEEDAVREGRHFDGRFWYWPGRIAELLGYRKEAAVARVREQFNAYSATELRGSWRTADGAQIDLTGPLLYPTKLEATIREAGQRGRDRHTEWRVRDALVDLARRHFVLIPSDLLNCGDVDPRTWANCMRVYEELAYSFRANARKVGSGAPLALDLVNLAARVNLSTPARGKRSVQLSELSRYLGHLQSRGAIRWERTTMASGNAGALVTLESAYIRDRLSGIANTHATLAAGDGRRRKASGPAPLAKTDV